MSQSTRTYAAPDRETPLEEHAPLALEEAVVLGANVERLRLQTSMSVARFASRADISRPFIYKVESGVANPKLSDIKKLANALGVSVIDLLTPPSKPDQEDQQANR